MKAVSRICAPVGETSTGVPWISLMSRSGLSRADPEVPMSSNHQRWSSPT